VVEGVGVPILQFSSLKVARRSWIKMALRR